MNATLFWISTFIASLVVVSFMEWALHRFVMHKNLKFFSYPFRAHAGIHHGQFRADHTYHAGHGQDTAKITMAWWNGPAITVIASLLPLFISWWTWQWSIVWIFSCVCFGYYCTYEYIHWCMHLPKERKLEQLGAFRFLNGHHILHHRYMHKNFNVVLPLADLCMGTLLLRSKVRFCQPRPSRITGVPDVQPLGSA